MSIETKKAILIEKKQVFEQTFIVDLIQSCSIENGILKLTQEEKQYYTDFFKKNISTISFFIPASGSGSRMFAFLYKWLENGEETAQISQFFEKMTLFPFFNELIAAKKNKKEIVEEIIQRFASLPKGLIPFHSYKNGVRTAFQEHATQIKCFFGKESMIHFTVQKDFEEDIQKNLENFSEVSFSYQNDETDAYCFDENKDVVKQQGEFLRRPAGHGALLENLNKLNSDIIVIKNIDNVQHFSKAETFHSTSQELIGLLKSFKIELKKLLSDFSIENLKNLNQRFPFLQETDVEKMTYDDVLVFSKRPTRVCGMVKNEGEPGGGPFWISAKKGMNNQIIEKAQIDFENEQQLAIVQESSHFNPVFITLSKTDVNGNLLDLMKFRDESKIFVVSKNYKGKKIFYRELPGLWNGSMSNWNTIFVEIPLAVFTPVKSVMDLLKTE